MNRGGEWGGYGEGVGRGWGEGVEGCWILGIVNKSGTQGH